MEWGDGVLAAGLEPAAPRPLRDGGDIVGGRRERARGWQWHIHSMWADRSGSSTGHVATAATAAAAGGRG